MHVEESRNQTSAKAIVALALQQNRAQPLLTCPLDDSQTICTCLIKITLHISSESLLLVFCFKFHK